MTSNDIPSIGPHLSHRTLDRLLLDEAQHRVSNEIGSAIAAMHMIRAARGNRTRNEIIDIVVSRLQSFADCSRLLAASPSGPVDAASSIGQTVQALLRSRVGNTPDQVSIELTSVVVDGEIARRLSMIAHEIVTNALRHAFSLRGGILELRLERLPHQVVLTICDNGPGIQGKTSCKSADKRLGGLLLNQLVSSIGGSIDCHSGPGGTAVHVSVPILQGRHDSIGGSNLQIN